MAWCFLSPVSPSCCFPLVESSQLFSGGYLFIYLFAYLFLAVKTVAHLTYSRNTTVVGQQGMTGWRLSFLSWDWDKVLWQEQVKGERVSSTPHSPSSGGTQDWRLSWWQSEVTQAWSSWHHIQVGHRRLIHTAIPSFAQSNMPARRRVPPTVGRSSISVNVNKIMFHRHARSPLSWGS